MASVPVSDTITPAANEAVHSDRLHCSGAYSSVGRATDF